MIAGSRSCAHPLRRDEEAESPIQPTQVTQVFSGNREAGMQKSLATTGGGRGSRRTLTSEAVSIGQWITVKLIVRIRSSCVQ